MGEVSWALELKLDRPAQDADLVVLIRFVLRFGFYFLPELSSVSSVNYQRPISF